MPQVEPRRSSRLARRATPVVPIAAVTRPQTRARAAEASATTAATKRSAVKLTTSAAPTKKSRTTKAKSESGLQTVTEAIAQATGEKRPSNNKKKRKVAKKACENDDSARGPEGNDPGVIDSVSASAQVVQPAVPIAPRAPSVELRIASGPLTRLQVLTGDDELSDQEWAALLARADVQRRKREVIIALGIGLADVMDVEVQASQGGSGASEKAVERQIAESTPECPARRTKKRKLSSESPCSAASEPSPVEIGRASTGVANRQYSPELAMFDVGRNLSDFSLARPAVRSAAPSPSPSRPVPQMPPAIGRAFESESARANLAGGCRSREEPLETVREETEPSSSPDVREATVRWNMGMDRPSYRALLPAVVDRVTYRNGRDEDDDDEEDF